MHLMKALLLFLLSIALVASADTEHPRKPAVAHVAKPTLLSELAHLGRCSGDASCTACSNCSRCAYCAGGGGTCGVCAPPPPAKPVYLQSRSLAGGSRAGGHSYGRVTAPTTLVPQLEVGGDYYITVSTLNLRTEPSAEAEVVRVLNRNDQVTVQELTSAKWVKVSVATEEGEVEGYVSRAYLSGTMSAE